MSPKQIEQSVRGSIHWIQNMSVMIITVPLIMSPRVQAKRFWIAHTYSGFCFLTRNFHTVERGEYFGPKNTFTKKSRKNQITTKVNKVKSFV
jgi:hypothetical protein